MWGGIIETYLENLASYEIKTDEKCSSKAIDAIVSVLNKEERYPYPSAPTLSDVAKLNFNLYLSDPLFFLNRMLLDPFDQSLRDPLWIFQLGEMADTRHDFQGEAVTEGFRAHHRPGDLRNATVHFASNTQCRHGDSTVKQAAEFE